MPLESGLSVTIASPQNPGVAQKPWFLISYDVANSRRLQRVHKLLKKRGHALLESLFVFNGSAEALLMLRDQLCRELNPREDDLLIYRLRSDRPVHRWGTACLPQGLYDFSLPSLIEHRYDLSNGTQNWSNFRQLIDQKTISFFDLASN